MTIRVFILIALLGFSEAASSAKEPDIYQYSSPEKIMTEAKAREYLSAFYWSSGKVSLSSLNDSDVEKARAKIKTLVDVRMQVFADANKIQNGQIETSVVYGATHGGAYLPPPPQPPGPESAPEKVQFVKKYFYIRKSSSLIDSDYTTSAGKITSEQKADGALVSYNRNFSTSLNTWNAQGAVEAPIEFLSDHSQNTLQEAWFTPAVQFNKLGGNGVANSKKLDSLEADLGSYMVADYNEVGTSLIRFGEVTQSDFNFKSLIVGGEAEYQMINPDACLGNPIPLFVDQDTGGELCSFMQRVVLHFDGGEIFDPGNKTTIHAGEVYLRAGPQYVLDLFAGPRLGLSPDVAKNSKLEFRYGHYGGFEGVAYNDYLVSLNVGLDKQGVFGLAITYENGGLNANGDKADQVTVGLTIKQ